MEKKMTDKQKYEFYNSDAFFAAVLFAVLSWAAYWAQVGVGSITDPLKRSQTAQAVIRILSEQQRFVELVKGLVISDSAIAAAATPEDITPAMIQSAVTGVMTNSLEFLL